MREISISEIKALASNADAKELASLKRSLAGDPRSGVSSILDKAQKRIDKEVAETTRLDNMYSYEREFCESDAEIVVGLDEVGRGPIAGPVAVGAVVLPRNPKISGLNDSKKVPESKREEIAREIQKFSIAHTVVFVNSKRIDEIGIAASLKEAFKEAIRIIDYELGTVDRVLLDGNPLYLDSRETNIVKGDSKCASIAAASIIAKVARDSFMRDIDREFPQYKFAENKGYGTQAHIEAVREFGLCDLHRKSFCSGIIQERLF